MNGISIIICCFNSVNRIKPTLEHISKLQSFVCPAWELIIVDNASNDSTRDTASQLCKTLGIMNCIMIDEGNPGLMHARKRGVGTAKYDIIVFCDDDNWLHEDYLDHAYSSFQNFTSAGLIGGSNLPVYEITPPAYFKNYNGYLALEACSGTDISECSFVSGAGMVASKSLLKDFFLLQSILTGRTGNTLLAGDDTEICIYATQIGYKIYRNPLLVLKHFIEKRRINDNYIEKLHYGIGSSNFYIDVLERTINNQTQFPYFIYRLFRITASRALASAALFVSFTLSIEKRAKLRNKVSYQKGYAKEAIKNIQSLDYITSVIISNQNKIDELKAKNKEKPTLQNI